MSHFSVLVISPGDSADEVEALMAPFHEFECTGVEDQYVKEIDVTEEVKKELARGTKLSDALDLCGVDGETIFTPEETLPAIFDSTRVGKYGYAVVKDGELIKAVQRTNPDAEWDWWSIGGRWKGFLELKPGCVGKMTQSNDDLVVQKMLAELYAKRGTTPPVEPEVFGVNQARKGDVDFARMEQRAKDDAEADWKSAYEALRETIPIEGTLELEHPTGEGVVSIKAQISETDLTNAFLPWKHCVELFPGEIGMARDLYRRQPGVSAIQKLGWWEADVILTTKEEFVSRAVRKAYLTYAAIFNGKWYSRGKMGWFGHSNDKIELVDWETQFKKLLADTPDDYWLTIVDCHI